MFSPPENGCAFGGTLAQPTLTNCKTTSMGPALSLTIPAPWRAQGLDERGAVAECQADRAREGQERRESLRCSFPGNDLGGTELPAFGYERCGNDEGPIRNRETRSKGLHEKRCTEYGPEEGWEPSSPDPARYLKHG